MAWTDITHPILVTLRSPCLLKRPLTARPTSNVLTRQQRARDEVEDIERRLCSQYVRMNILIVLFICRTIQSNMSSGPGPRSSLMGNRILRMVPLAQRWQGQAKSTPSSHVYNAAHRTESPNTLLAATARSVGREPFLDRWWMSHKLGGLTF